MKIVDASINFQRGMNPYLPRKKGDGDVFKSFHFKRKEVLLCLGEMEQVRQDSVP